MLHRSPNDMKTVNLQYSRKMLNYGSSTLWKLKTNQNVGGFHTLVTAVFLEARSFVEAGW